MKILVDPSSPDHPKIWALADALKIGDVEAYGMVVRLWCKSMQLRESGSFVGWTERHIARAAGFAKWEKESEGFVKAFVDVELLDKIDGGYRIHDWLEHQGPLIERREYDRERMREKRQAIAINRSDSNGKQEGPPSDQGSSLAARCAAVYRKICPIINQQSATNLIQFALDAGANPQAVEHAFYDAGAIKGKKVWQVLETLVPKEAKKSRDWTDAMLDIIQGRKQT